MKTITGVKDNVKIKRDVQRRGIRKNMCLSSNPKKPAALYVLTSEEFGIFVSTIKSLKTPLGHISNNFSYTRKKNFGGLKSYDYHVLMQQLLSLALEDLLQLGPKLAMMWISKVFWRICNKF